MQKKLSTEKKYDDAASTVADMYDVTPAYVRMVVNGDRINPAIKEAYRQYKKGKNSLIKAIEKQTKIAS